MSTKTIDQLRRDLAAAEAEATEATEAKAARLHAAQDTWRRNLTDTVRTIEDTLEAAEREAAEAAREHAAEGDWQTALQKFAEWLTTRDARAAIRNEAQNAASALGIEPHTVAELRYIPVSITGFIESGIHDYRDRHLDDIVGRHLTKMPTEID